MKTHLKTDAYMNIASGGGLASTYIYEEEQMTLPKLVRQTLRLQTARAIAKQDPRGVRLGIKTVLETHNQYTGLKFTLPGQAAETIEAILERFGDLAPTEIFYAFKRERSLSEADAVEHYGKTTTRYYVTVLENYRERKRNELIRQNIERPPLDAPEPMELSDGEKRKLIQNGVREAWLYFLEFETVETGRLWLFEEIIDQGRAAWTDQDLEAVAELARHRLKNSLRGGVESFSPVLTQQVFGGRLKAECRRILLERFMRDCREQKTTLYDALYG